MLRTLLVVFSLFYYGNADIETVYKNVALHKPVTLSSYLNNTQWPGSNAVNGILNDHAHTFHDKNPYLRIDLEKNYHIFQIEVFSRQLCCGNQLHDFVVKVGRTLDGMTVCGYYSGFAKDAERIGIYCPYAIVGRYVEIQIIEGFSNILTPAEVIVWGK